MLLHIGKNRLIGDIQREFNLLFPFLRLEFYRVDESNIIPSKRFLPEKYSLQYAGHNPNEGDIHVNGEDKEYELIRSTERVVRILFPVMPGRVVTRSFFRS